MDDMGRCDGGRGKKKSDIDNSRLADLDFFFFVKTSKMADVFYGWPRRYLQDVGTFTGYLFVSPSAIELKEVFLFENIAVDSLILSMQVKIQFEHIRIICFGFALCSNTYLQYIHT